MDNQTIKLISLTMLHAQKTGKSRALVFDGDDVLEIIISKRKATEWGINPDFIVLDEAAALQSKLPEREPTDWDHHFNNEE